MLETYSKFDETDIINAVQTKTGLTKKEENKKLEKNICPRCKHDNEMDATTCENCWLILDAKQAIEAEDKQQKTNKFFEFLANQKGFEEFLSDAFEKWKEGKKWESVVFFQATPKQISLWLIMICVMWYETGVK